MGCGHHPTLSEQSEHARKVGSGQDLGVGHSVLPGYAKDTADASHVEGIESFLLSGICGPRGASVVLCTSSGAGEGRRPCLLLTFQLGSHTVFQHRHVLQLLHSDQDDLCNDFANDAENGDVSVDVAVTPLSLVLEECDDLGVPRVLWHSSLPALTGVHAENAVMWSCSALVGLVGSRRCHRPCQKPSCRWPCWAPPKLALCLVLPWSAGIEQHQGLRMTQCSLWSRGRSSVRPISPTDVLYP